MTPDTTNLEERIDRDRCEREAELLALLALLLLRARQYGDAAIRLGTDPFSAIAAVIMGSPLLGLPGGTERIARQLALADAAGFRRTLLVLPGEPDYRPGVWRTVAAIALSQMLGTLNRRVAQAFSRNTTGTQGARLALREAFRTGGYVDAGKGPWLLNATAGLLVGQAYDAGYRTGLFRPEVRAQLRGFRYSATLDEVTTTICRTYHGTQLPADHPWWLTHWPKNHHGCRAVVLPLFREFTVTEDPPYFPPPMAGFGGAPLNFTGRAA